LTERRYVRAAALFGQAADYVPSGQPEKKAALPSEPSLWRSWRASTAPSARWLRRMRCSGGCGGRVRAAWLVTGPILSARVRPRRVPLLGPEARDRVWLDTSPRPSAAFSAAPMLSAGVPSADETVTRSDVTNFPLHTVVLRGFNNPILVRIIHSIGSVGVRIDEGQ